MISILVTTYNRPDKLKRCLASILAQTYTDFEVIIIDDASDCEQDLPSDPRIKYHRNTINVGSKHGDRAHIKDFLSRLATGEYFIYLCDDDYWISDTLLERQIALFAAHPTASVVIGGQMSDFGTHTQFHADIYPKEFMTSAEFLAHFAAHPIECNIIIGATLYKREAFGSLSNNGAKWQAGYEMLMRQGDVCYINEPCVMVEVRPENASFQGTQLDHYHDCIKSVKAAKLPIDIEKETIKNIGQAFLRNAEHIKAHGSLTMCTAHNISQPVTEADLLAHERA